MIKIMYISIELELWTMYLENIKPKMQFIVCDIYFN